MAIFQALTIRTADRADSVSDYKGLLLGRLMALSRVQALLTRQANGGASLRHMLESELGAQASHQDQFNLAGPEIVLSPKAAEVLTLAFHELATNALKYGALSVQGGVVSVSWSTAQKRGDPWLSLDWIEEGAPDRTIPTGRGFGSQLIEGRIPYELGGSGQLTFEGGAARCHFEFPLRHVESVFKTDSPLLTAVSGGVLDMSGAPDLSGHSILVVEDDYYQASDLAAALKGAGAVVLGPCPSEETARHVLEAERPTGAVLDLNLGGGGPKFDMARYLLAQGIPFIFLTGYDLNVIPDELVAIKRFQKPFEFRNVIGAIGSFKT